MTGALGAWVAVAVSPYPWVAVDGVGLPEVGWSTGWIGLIFLAVLFSRGKLLTEKDHLERVQIMQTLHEAAITAKNAEIDRINHDRMEWRTESRIKDAQFAEKDAQLAEQAKQLAAVSTLGRTVEAILTAIRPLPGGQS